MQPDYIDRVARTPLSQILIFAFVLTVYRILTHRYLRTTPEHRRSMGYKVVYGVGEIFDALIYAAVFIFLVIRPFVLQTFRIPSGSMVPTLLVGDAIVLNKAIYRYSEPQRGDIVVFRPPVEGCFEEADQIETLPDGTKRVKVDFVKRLIGLPGDLVEIRDGKVFINGQEQNEPYRHYTRQLTNEPSPNQHEVLTPDQEKTVPKYSWKLVNYRQKLIPLSYTDVSANSPRYGADYPVASVYRIDDPSEWDSVRKLPAQKIPEGMYLFIGDNRNGSFDGRGWGLVPRRSIIGRAEFRWFPVPRISRVK